ncbi:MAG TPA: dihydroxy-acid dehydratase [Candidatus Bathyarchaeia archaeon]|nr:dihydroxy-acid dehydratase [Candidatus Bathyarchaeia archaeon]
MINKVKLRSAFEPGSWQWVLRREQWKAIGIKDEDFDKPKIAVVNTSSNISVCYIHLDEVSKAVQAAIREAGGLPFEIHTAAPSDAITSLGLDARYLMPTRDLVVNDIEVMVEGALLDGMVCLSSCDKTTPAHLMAAVRLNLPTIVLPCGYQLGGVLDSKPVDWEDVYEAQGAVRKGEMTLSYLQRMTDVAVCGPGVCPGLGTANTMHIVSEALGMSLPGGTPIRAGSPKLFEYARQAGKRIVQVVLEDLRPRDIVTERSIENSVRVVQAIGGSVNSVRHLCAIATEAELQMDVVSTFERLADDSVTLTSIRPNGLDRIEDLEAAGGTRAVMKQLSSKLNTDVKTVSGLSLSKVLEGVEIVNEQVIRPLSKPVRNEAGLIIIRGNLAPDGAIVKLSAVAREMFLFEGPARVYEDEYSAQSDTKNMKQNDVIILRGLGPKGGPGTVFVANFVAAVIGAGLGKKIAVVTDGELSGENRGLTIGQMMPEAAEGGPLAIIEQGDKIRIDINKRRIDLLAGDQVVKERLKNWKPKQRKLKRSWLSMYAELVQPISKGAVLGDISGRDKPN